MKRELGTIVLAISLLALAGISEAKTIRALELDRKSFAELQSGDATVEFREGDQLPVTISAMGDLLETSQQATSYVTVKKSFWLRIQNNSPQISFDGTSFKDIKDALSGSLEANAGGDQNNGLANAINVNFKALLK